MRSRELNDSTTSREWKLGREAAEWLLRLENPDPDEPGADAFERHAAFLNWLERSPEHVRAVLETREIQERLRSPWLKLLPPTDNSTDRTDGEAPRPAGVTIHRRFFRKKYRQIGRGWAVGNISGRLASSQRLLRKTQAATDAASQRRELWFGGLSVPTLPPATAVLVAGTAVALAAAAFMAGTRPPPPFTADYSTGVGEREYVWLPDGSRITLNTATRISVEYGRHLRQVRLQAGEALFEVHHDAHRPFRVLGREAQVEDLGTRFDLYQKPTGMQVWVIDGRVHLQCACQTRTARASVTLDGRQMAEVVGPVGTATLTTHDVSAEAVEHATAWRDGEMWFNGDKLATAVAEFNRYSPRQLVIVDPSLADIRVGGRYMTPDVDTFLATLHAAFGIRALPDDSTDTDPRDVNGPGARPSLPNGNLLNPWDGHAPGQHLINDAGPPSTSHSVIRLSRDPTVHPGAGSSIGSGERAALAPKTPGSPRDR